MLFMDNDIFGVLNRRAHQYTVVYLFITAYILSFLIEWKISLLMDYYLYVSDNLSTRHSTFIFLNRDADRDILIY